MSEEVARLNVNWLRSLSDLSQMIETANVDYPDAELYVRIEPGWIVIEATESAD